MVNGKAPGYSAPSSDENSEGKKQRAKPPAVGLKPTWKPQNSENPNPASKFNQPPDNLPDTSLTTPHPVPTEATPTAAKSTQRRCRSQTDGNQSRPTLPIGVDTPSRHSDLTTGMPAPHRHSGPPTVIPPNHHSNSPTVIPNPLPSFRRKPESPTAPNAPKWYNSPCQRNTSTRPARRTTSVRPAGVHGIAPHPLAERWPSG